MSLTLVYSSRHDNSAFQQHLQQTCGVKYLQILGFNNPGRYSLSEVYNQALKQATHDFIVFVHDDVIFETPDWGQKLLKHLQSSEFGILGVAGTTYLPNSGIWWQDTTRTVGRVKHPIGEKILISHYSGDFEPQIIPVVCIDGVLMAVNRKKLQAIFNESLLGFHFYDIDFCTQNYVAGVAIGVIFDIKIIHRSIGQVNDKWEENRLKFINSHTHHLPCRLEPKIIADCSLVSLSRYPKVTIIILHKSKNSLLFNCLLSIAEKSTYPNYEIIIADTGSSTIELAELIELIEISQLNIKLIQFAAYHFGRVNNAVVSQHVDSELVLFCNNDIELINDAISRMVKIYLENSNDCGTIGCRLHFADNTVQHAGIELLINPQRQLEISHYGLHTDYRYSMAVEKNVLGATAAFLLMKTTLFQKISGFNCDYLHSLEDVELNLRCIAEGKNNYLAGDAVCYHFESQTRLNQGKIQQQDYQRLVQFLQSNSRLLSKIPRMQGDNHE
jgi:GT2 family glycosyltransferase